MAITTSSSIKVKPPQRRGFILSLTTDAGRLFPVLAKTPVFGPWFEESDGAMQTFMAMNLVVWVHILTSR
jgi:hypothetical protein